MTTTSATRGTFGTKSGMLSALESQLVTGRIAPGQKLPSERELGIEYRVSRTVVRETLSGLADRGYIEIIPGRGSFARPPEATDLAQPMVRIAQQEGVTSRDLVEARKVLECAAASSAAHSATADDIATLNEALAAHLRADGLDQRVSTDLAFHRAIARASGNPVLEVMFTAIGELVSDLMYRSHSDPQVHAAGDPLHDEILACIRSRDGVGAAEAMRRHLDLALQLYGPDVDEPIRDVLRRRGIASDHTGD
ncbi:MULTISPECIES: FadR/GntR family transcriptional regulator [unclassified Microbacterium]|uniref:FadR/GntR family transcriptional regulator n=1 Tax=unclassified Microbacterium TaxID=2609290 RepID=UPI003439441B